MEVFTLKGETRQDLGKKATKALRVAGKVPCVLYGGGENLHFDVLEDDLRNLLYTPKVYLVDLMIDGVKHSAVMREIQFHPVTDGVLHMDFIRTFEDQPVVVEVPVRTEGFAVGVQAGGKLTLVTRKVKVKALPSKLPDIITINVENLGIGKSIKVKDLHIEGLEMMNAKSVVIAQVKVTRASRATDSAAAATTSTTAAE